MRIKLVLGGVGVGVARGRRRSRRGRASCILGRVRREQADRAERHRRQDGVGQSPHVDPHGRESGRTGTMERWMVEGGPPNSLLRRGSHEGLAAAGNRGVRRGLPGEGSVRIRPTAGTSRSPTAGSCSSVRRAPARRKTAGTQPRSSSARHVDHDDLARGAGRRVVLIPTPDPHLTARHCPLPT